MKIAEKITFETFKRNNDFVSISFAGITPKKASYSVSAWKPRSGRYYGAISSITCGSYEMEYGFEGQKRTMFYESKEKFESSIKRMFNKCNKFENFHIY